MTTLIFSKNRAMQLDALLRSMEEYFPHAGNVCVLYTTSQDNHFISYHRLGFKYYKNVSWFSEYNFKEELECIITSNNDQVCFLVDDDIFYKSVPLSSVFKPAPNETISLRLGENVNNKNHFNYSISLDGNIFNAKEILTCMQEIEYRNPNELEGRLVQFHDRFEMTWSEQYLVGIPHNRVSSSSGCKYSGKYHEDELAEMFLDGKRIDYKAMDYSNITSVHAEIDYVFYDK